MEIAFHLLSVKGRGVLKPECTGAHSVPVPVLFMEMESAPEPFFEY